MPFKRKEDREKYDRDRYTKKVIAKVKAKVKAKAKPKPKPKNVKVSDLSCI